jgi:tRNA-dihydrouridine synthase B
MEDQIKIGSLKLKNRFLLAPMLEPNDIAFRLLCKKAGCDLTYTGMTSPLSKKKLHLDDSPAVQIFGNSTKDLKKFIKKHESSVSLFDFNLGCPSKLSKKLCHGSYLTDLKKIEEILKEIRNNTKKPLTVKIRKSSQAEKILKLAEKYCDALTIHPRTKTQGYSGLPDLKFAEKLKKKAKIPIIYSGDVDEENAEDLLKKFDFVMFGRSVIGRPEIFAKLTKNKTNIQFKDYLKLAKKYDLPFRQVKMQAMNFTKGKKQAKETRRKIIKAKTIGELL